MVPKWRISSFRPTHSTYLGPATAARLGPGSSAKVSRVVLYRPTPTPPGPDDPCCYLDRAPSVRSPSPGTGGTAPAPARPLAATRSTLPRRGGRTGKDADAPLEVCSREFLGRRRDVDRLGGALRRPRVEDHDGYLRAHGDVARVPGPWGRNPEELPV